jgi:hypothetical protein
LPNCNPATNEMRSAKVIVAAMTVFLLIAIMPL